MQTFKILTLGCKVNQYESQAIRENLSPQNLSEVSSGVIADVYVINTCTVTDKADRESFYLINRAIKENPKAKIIVTGCLVEKDKDKILNRFGGRVEIIKNSQKTYGISDFKGHDRAFVKIQDGCDNFCSYCKVPLVRGRSKSRPLDEIIKEVNCLTERGFKEIVLTGICLGAYGRDLSPKLSLADVLERLGKINNIARIRLSSIEAEDVSKDLIKAICNYKFISKHLHLPLQSGDDRILKKMNRKFLTKDFLGLVSNLRKKIPQIAITTDVIIGFPYETNKNFLNTLNFIKKINPSRTHIFSYSDRAGTKAVEFFPKVSDEDKKKRFLELKKVCDNLAYQYHKKFLNKEVRVLVESARDKKNGFQVGYTDNYIKILVDSKNDLRRELVNLKINKVTKENIYAKYPC
ncbi:MAG: MiaB/RimO family radical SAM methylthiotransferase [Candidatus Omnitrophota bacterium]